MCVRGLATAAAPAKIQRPKHTGPPTVQSTAAEIKYLGTVYSIAASSNHLTKDKLEFVVREAKSEKDLPFARESLDTYERNFLLIPTHCTGTFVSKCIQNNQADMALQWMQDSKFLPKHIVNGTFSRLIDHYSDVGQVDKALAVFDVVTKHKIEATTKVYTSMIKMGKKNGKADLALEFATKASHAKMINSHALLQLVGDLPDSDVRDLMPVVKDLAHLGEVFVNKELAALFARYEMEAEPVAASSDAAADEDDADDDAADETTDKKD
ncbi:hypothetical protein DYB32_008763 [Aphanomyces invadans]|nr:hypothetical protein DYB32_008763 [Aphanomyces invadans]